MPIPFSPITISFVYELLLNDMNNQYLPIGKDKVEYFTLKDLWECYDEWSVYGAGTPLVLESADILSQYYIPFFICNPNYTNKPIQSPSPRCRK
ncbi:unnamed protein product [Lupinus luteus]|uniref:Uncharacterized protein n=1 Tax=Lupinus luteus TaxID=3873 RepID=A0AAV1XHU1_LUPLU